MAILQAIAQYNMKTFARLAICILAALVAATPFKYPSVMMMVVIKWYPTF